MLLDWKDVSLPSHCWTNGWQPSKTIVTDGWLSEKPLKNHWYQWLSWYHSINGNGDPTNHWFLTMVLNFLLSFQTKAKIKQAFKKMLITCFRIANLTLESCYVWLFIVLNLPAMCRKIDFVAKYPFFSSVTIVNQKNWKTIEKPSLPMVDPTKNHRWWWWDIFKNHRHSIVRKIWPSPFHRHKKLTIAPVYLTFYNSQLDLVQLCETQKTSLNNRLFKIYHMLGLSGTLLCICAFDTWEYNLWYLWSILFS